MNPYCLRAFSISSCFQFLSFIPCLEVQEVGQARPGPTSAGFFSDWGLNFASIAIFYGISVSLHSFLAWFLSCCTCRPCCGRHSRRSCCLDCSSSSSSSKWIRYCPEKKFTSLVLQIIKYCLLNYN